MKIVSVGGAGGPNFGDELIVRGWIEYFLSRGWRDLQVTFFENIDKHTAGLMAPLVASAKGNIRFSHFLVDVSKAVNDLTFWQQVERGFTFLDRGGISRYPSPHWSTIEAADVLHLHGGGYLNDMGPQKGFLLGLCAALKKRHGMKLVATGIGFGPVREQPAGPIATEAMTAFDLFEVRDLPSHRTLTNLFPDAAILFGHDDCYLLPVDRIVKRKPVGNPVLHLSYLEYNVGKFTDAYWQSLNEIAAVFSSVVFWESYPWQDKRLLEVLIRKLPRIDVIPLRESVAGRIQVASDDFVIAARFHVHYVLARAGLTGIFLKDTPYYDAKHRSILLRGSPFKEGSANEIALPALRSPGVIAITDQSNVTAKRTLADLIFA